MRRSRVRYRSRPRCLVVLRIEPLGAHLPILNVPKCMQYMIQNVYGRLLNYGRKGLKPFLSGSSLVMSEIVEKCELAGQSYMQHIVVIQPKPRF
jgi:hypothetical protein